MASGAPRPVPNVTYFTVSLFDAHGDSVAVQNLTGDQRFTFSIPVPDCEERNACTMHVNLARNRRCCMAADHGGCARLRARVYRVRPIGQMQLMFWDETAGNWSNTGVYRDDEAILASGDNCTFVGYTTHFTTFTLGGLSIKLNAINPATVCRRA